MPSEAKRRALTKAKSERDRVRRLEPIALRGLEEGARAVDGEVRGLVLLDAWRIRERGRDGESGHPGPRERRQDFLSFDWGMPRDFARDLSLAIHPVFGSASTLPSETVPRSVGTTAAPTAVPFDRVACLGSSLSIRLCHAR
ncbi:MAG: hypothetical protein M3O91_03020 [Chloroflexota bacterium]|nr:hypothetical protein [Chloroflexota bacterium]